MKHDFQDHSDGKHCFYGALVVTAALAAAFAFLIGA
jgi:hypothetical protein